jgi:hypothetical protein
LRIGPKKEKVKGDWRKLHNEELRDLYSSIDTVRVIKLRRRGAGMWHIWGRREILVGNLEGE